MSRIIGIDLGTTNSLVAVWENGKSKLIPNAFGDTLTPSAVSVDEDGVAYVGRVAKERLVSAPKCTVSVFKRAMGSSQTYKMNQKEYKPEELSALVLRQLKEDAEAYLQEAVEEAIISVPAYFNDMARKAVRDAGILAGLKVERIINEPSAAALATRMLDDKTEELVLVFDFGGGTLDVSLVDCFDNIVEIIAVSGDNHLGGADFDQLIAEEFCRKNQLDFRHQTAEAEAILMRKAEELKHALTKQERAVMRVTGSLVQGEMELCQKELIQISASIFNKISVPIRRVLSDAKVSPEQLSKIVLVGGSCKMPIVQKYLQYSLEHTPISTLEPDAMVALGIGTYAGIKERNGEIKDLLLTDICPFSLGAGVYNEQDPNRDLMKIMIERNSALPTSRETRLWTVHDNQTTIRVDVYQGEEMYAENNMCLGTISMEVPAAEKERESILIRYTYDINGLLVVDVSVCSTNQQKQLIIMNEQYNLSEQELKKRLKELELLKVHPRKQEENKFLISQGERLFIQAVGELREEIEVRLQYFEYVLSQQDEYKIVRYQKYFGEFLKSVEHLLNQTSNPFRNAEEFEEWFGKDANREEEEEYTAWRKHKYLS